MTHRRTYLSLVAAGVTGQLAGVRSGAGESNQTVYPGEARSADEWNQTDKLIPNEDNDDPRFGDPVSIDGNIAIVGASSDDNANGEGWGAAIIFERRGNGWTRVTKLIDPDGDERGDWSSAVGIQEGTAFVGAPLKNAVYVFTQDGDNWTHQSTIAPDEMSRSPNFGSAISVDQNRVLIGADGDTVPRGEYSGTTPDGAAYVFEKRDDTWTQEDRLYADDAEGNASFGESVALENDSAIIGAPEKDTQDGVEAGAAYLFEKRNGEWTQQTRVTADNGAATDPFGLSVALSGQIALVSAKYNDVAGETSPGKAYVLENRDGEWSKSEELVVDRGELFGRGLTLENGTAIIGADNARGPNGNNGAGTAHVFEETDQGWSHQTQLFHDDSEVGDSFGEAVSLSGGNLLIGAPGKNSGTGAAYVFEREGTKTTSETSEKVSEISETRSGTIETISETDESGEDDTTNNDTSEEDVPGFGIVGGISALGGVGYLLKRRFDRHNET